MENSKTDIFTMPLHEDRRVGPASVMRVPGGWIYSNAIGGMVFVPITENSKALEMREALEAARVWIGSGMGPVEHFEAIGEMFYKATGFLRPGKSEPVETYYEGRETERDQYWADWCKDVRAKLDARILAALALEGQ